MRRRATAIASEEAAAIRFAWWAAFFATLTLIVVLGIAKSAQALTVPPAANPIVAAPSSPADGEDENEAEAEASEDEGFEDEECEDEEEVCEDEGDDAEAPAECLLTSAEPAVFATVNKGMVRLQVRYTTFSPTVVAVDYGLHGGKGSLYLGGDRKHFARQGVLRLSKTLTEAQMAKVVAAKGFTVRLRVPSAPGYCKSFFDYQLNIRQATPTGLAWQAAA